MGRVLGLDFGTVRIGAALSDAGRRVAAPFEIFTRGDQAREDRYFVNLVKTQGVDRIVVGLPVRGSGSEGSMARLSRAWGERLARLTSIEVLFVDERYTSVEAEYTLIDAGVKRARRKRFRDRVAAQILLQNYLDAGCPDVEEKFKGLDDRAARESSD